MWQWTALMTLKYAGLNLDLLWVWQLDAGPFFENYGKLYFDARHLATKEIEHGVVKFLMPFLANISDASLIF